MHDGHGSGGYLVIGVRSVLCNIHWCVILERTGSCDVGGAHDGEVGSEVFVRVESGVLGGDLVGLEDIPGDVDVGIGCITLWTQVALAK